MMRFEVPAAIYARIVKRKYLVKLSGRLKKHRTAKAVRCLYIIKRPGSGHEPFLRREVLRRLLSIFLLISPIRSSERCLNLLNISSKADSGVCEPLS